MPGNCFVRAAEAERLDLPVQTMQLLADKSHPENTVSPSLPTQVDQALLSTDVERGRG